MNDELLESVRRGFAPVHLDQPLQAIETRRRAHRRHRTLVAAAATALVAGLGVTLASQAGGSSPPPVAQAPSQAPVPVAFTVTSTADGKVTVTILEVITNPASLEKALADIGVSAVIRVNEVCESEPLPDNSLRDMLATTGREWLREEFHKTITIDKRLIPPSVTLSITLIAEGNSYTGEIGFGFYQTGYPVTCKPASKPWQGK